VNFKEEMNISGSQIGYRWCLMKAMDGTQKVLREDDSAYNFGKIHAVKSILYATIEQAGMETDRLISAQELLRELLTLVALSADPVHCERHEASQDRGEAKSPASSLPFSSAT